ncbi:MAG: phospho-N-acetylmuramoyl-pentapeptide-transferase, partial [Chitinophagaceae bacterium]|nr:phospho-N-acetylmuramoyl-pentapeptide-transferase [Chitinophagaceae bacterium]
MLYQLYQWLIDEQLRFPGMGIFQFITFRAMLAVLLSLFITMVYGKHIILFLQKMQVGESVRELGLQGEEQKKGTPTMGGFIILLGILIPTLLFANLDKVYIKLLLLSTIWLGLVGFVDDYLKLRSKRLAQSQGVNYKKGDKDGLAGWFKVLGQVGLGVIISATLLFNDNVKVMREYKGKVKPANAIEVKYQGGVRYFVKAN